MMQSEENKSARNKQVIKNKIIHLAGISVMEAKRDLDKNVKNQKGESVFNED